jgi:preflagellin peptidase FlaK
MPLGSLPDLLRLVAVPVLGYAAWRDVRTRRVPNATWLPLAALGIALLGHAALVRLPFAGLSDRWFLIRVGMSLGFVVPVSYVFWRLGGFGGADAKALMTVAVLFPTYPTYYLPTVALPFERTTIGVFSMTVLSNAVLVGLAYPLALGVRNALAGERSPLMFFGRRVAVGSLPVRHGRLFETREGVTRSGLDLDALRMYLRWRDTSLAALRAAPATHRDPTSVGETHTPGDGAVAHGGATERVGDATGNETDAADGPEDAPTPGGSPHATADGEAGDAGRTDGEGERSIGGAGGDESARTTGAADEAEGERSAGGEERGTDGADDPWAAEAFLDAVEGDAYGTTPATLREGLETVVARDEVLISPGIPFLVPTFVGLLVGLTYGDLLFGLLSAVGAV